MHLYIAMAQKPLLSGRKWFLRGTSLCIEDGLNVIYLLWVCFIHFLTLLTPHTTDFVLSFSLALVVCG